MIDRRQFFGAILASLAASCAGERAPVAREPRVLRTRGQARERLEALARRYEPLMTEHGRHEWQRYAGKLQEGPAATHAMAELRAAEREVFFAADEILKRFGDGLTARRRATLWRRGALGLRLLGDPRSVELSDRLEATINGHE